MFERGRVNISHNSKTMSVRGTSNIVIMFKRLIFNEKVPKKSRIKIWFGIRHKKSYIVIFGLMSINYISGVPLTDRLIII